jgi:acetolactate synthase-1/2/3 large subunit
VSAGTARVVGAQAFELKQGQRFISNSSTASMGYDLPASIGACLARENSPVICVTGDGSLQMNIQELQTIKQNNLPIKIFVMNNEGYYSIRMTQSAYFPERKFVGIGEVSGDLSFPDLSRIAAAYGYPYYACRENKDLDDVISECLSQDGCLICEVFVSTDQRVEPKVASRKLANGKFVSAPLEDMAPFLPREELKQNMCIPLVDEE